MTALAGVQDTTPALGALAPGKHITENAGNVAAAQRQIGHKNAIYSMQYSRITAEELHDVINGRD